MSLNENQTTAQNFKEFYGQIRPYLNGAAHSGFTPVGVVISVMGKTAPLNYLVCDGTVYNIADYPELAAYFARQFDVCNYFGGDGTTTFAVPDLRGEFLRGSGTNSHTNQGNGANVGVHQDGTAIPQMAVSSGGQFALTFSSGASMVTNTDAKQNKYNKYAISSSGSTKATDSDWDLYTSRPTNTSVLYCIAYKNIFVDEGCNYSIDEKVVGTWIDGKPVYQKTYIVSNVTSGKIIEDYSQKQMIDYSGVYLHTDGNRLHFPYYHGSTTMQMNQNANSGNLIIHCQDISGGTVYVTAQYTKTTD